MSNGWLPPGASYGGLIFAAKSPRCVDLSTAESLVTTANLQFVGVFVNQPMEQVAQYAHRLKLSVVQLHGGESDDYLSRLASHLPAGCRIWQAVRADKLPSIKHPRVDRLLIDSIKGQQFGGTGETFDWSSVPQSLRESAMLAGGLSPDNIARALSLGFAGVDVNSGVESAPGIKDADKLNALMAIVRRY